jgi:hypothetical protein
MNRSKAIKAYCRECAGGSFFEVLVCHLFDCPLWPYRTGYSAKADKKSLKIALEKHPDVAEELRLLRASALSARPQVPPRRVGRGKSTGTDETTGKEE